MRLKLLCFAGPLLLVLCGCDALAQPNPAPAPPSRPSDPLFDAAKSAFEGLPLAERKAVQDALGWTGNYNGTVAGEFGRRTFEAVNAYARRVGVPATGTLDAASRKALLAAGQQARDSVKFTVATDAATGIRLGVPERILVKREANPNGGTRWQSADGKITLDTRAVAPGAGDLASTFERSISVQAPGRQVTYKLFRPDFFVVAGETATGKFYTRYAAGPAGLRGFSVAYDKSLAKTFDKIVLAVANSFVPFPAAAPDAQAAAVPKPTPLPPDGVRPAGLVATGIAVTPALVLTSAAVGRCAEPRIANAVASVIKTDKDAGLVLLKAGGPPGTGQTGLAFSGEPDAGPLLVMSYAALFGKEEVVVTPANPLPAQVAAPLQPGAGGAPILDRRGALVGVVGSPTDTPGAVAGVMPPARWAMVSTGNVRTFLGEALAGPSDPASPAGSTAGDIATRWRVRIVPIFCG